MATLAAVTFAGVCIIGCGDTDGDGNTDAGLGTQYVSDGGAGGSITIDVKEDLTVGGTSPFMVSLRDAQGQPLTFVRIFCESEHGIAIIEPSKGGTAFESTDSYGNMSGVIGGMSPGSYMFECRAPIEYNLIARVSVKITGEIPAGFAGWPGAAGGNLGGGYTVPPDVENGGVRITAITFIDGSTSTLMLDNYQNTCISTSGSSSSATTTAEPFYDKSYRVSIANGSTSDVAITEIEVETLDGVGNRIGSGSMVQGVALDLATGATAQYAGNYVALLPTADYDVTVIIRGYYVGTGEDFEVSAVQNIRFSDYCHCSAGTSCTN
ncbi:MAG: hypothetical protein IT292_05985 [Deltaproteobacteria bacterium]|nr:hypothetical protein [Deltaproteobacteria bacterium]